MSADDAELRALRERAYGPRADIGTDAAAAARLDALQNPTASDEEADDAGAAVPRARPPRGARWVVALGLAVVVTAVAASAITAVVLGRPSPSRADGPATAVATLHPDPALPWLSQLSSDGETAAAGTRYDDYLGLAVASIPSRWGDGSRCVYVLPQTTAAALAGGCGAGPFAAQVTVVVTSDMPDAMLAAHEPGTPLRFSLEGDDVVVEVGDRYGAGAPPHSAR